jgi:hypothetical protein
MIDVLALQQLTVDAGSEADLMSGSFHSTVSIVC